MHKRRPAVAMAKIGTTTASMPACSKCGLQIIGDLKAAVGHPGWAISVKVPRMMFISLRLLRCLP